MANNNNLKNTMQSEIKIINGKIQSIKRIESGVKLIIDGKSYKYSNAYIYPGFVDSHGHIASLGSSVTGLNLNKAKSAEECVELCQNTNNFKGDWISGRGWNQEKWFKKELPTASILDDVFPDTPVFLVRVDGHCAWVNTEAMRRANINKFSKDSSGGHIARSKSGYPTGILFDDAIDLVKNKIPKYSKEQIKRNIIIATGVLAQQGITEVHDMDVNPSLIEIYKELSNEGSLPIRINSYISGHNEEWKIHHILPFHSKFYNVSGIKLYADGSLGSRTAAMIKSYTDDNDNKGMFLISNNELFKRAKLALEAGFDVAVHAIGDAANRMVLETYAHLFDNKIVDVNSILRLEHAQHIIPQDLQYFSKYPIVASVQPIHCISDVETITEKRIGTRINYAYPWKSIIDNGGILISGSDFPIEDFNVLSGIDAFVNRRPKNSQNSWFSNESLTINEAIKAYTLNPQNILGNQRGEIKVNNDADLVILDKDVHKINNNEIKRTKIIATITAGKIVNQV